MQVQQGNQLSETSPIILVVDDEVPIIELCTALLEEAGFTVLEAEGSSDALKICTQHRGPIDLLLADLVLSPPGFQLASMATQFPHLNGHDLALRASMIRSGLRIILMSGNPDKELASHGIKRGDIPIFGQAVRAAQPDCCRATRSCTTSADSGGRKATRVNGTEWFG
jgi:CheY-like chemotaxis protein